MSVNTTGDNGDSVMHYLFSHYSFSHPENFLDHWAKPLFVLLSSPFAYFGFKGMIIFNVLCTSLTALFTYYIARNLQLRSALLIFPFFLGAPLFFQLIFSGLTEYLFALITVIGIYLIQKDKLISAIILISFLPMVRSEGLIVIGVFGIYLLLEKHLKLMILLLTGQLTYTLIGAIYHQDLLWVMNDIPYTNVGSPYGHGGPFDFIFKLMFVIEKPIMLLLTLGISYGVYQLVVMRDYNKNKIKYILISGTFFAILSSHSLFWYLGIFNSMGLPRVLIVIVPLAIIISLESIEIVYKKIKQPKYIKIVLVSLSLLVLGFPFIPKNNGLVYDQYMFNVVDHDLIEKEVTPYVKETLPNYKEHVLYFSHPYLSCALEVDYFDHNKHMEMQHVLEMDLNPGTLIIWDNWFSISDGGIQLEQLLNHPHFKMRATFHRISSDEQFKFVIFEVIEKGSENI